jgi:PAS domain S-box-containing protein
MAYGDGRELDRLETALEAAGVAWWWMELPSGVVFYSPNKARMINREDEQFLHHDDFVKLVHPEDEQRIMQDMRNHLYGTAKIYETTYRIKAKDGSYRTFYDRGQIVARKGEEVTVAGIVFDITNFHIDEFKDGLHGQANR